MTREELYEAVWSEPMTKLATRFNVSGSYLARVCDSLNVPRPRRGYWAKLQAGKAPPRPAIAPVTQGEPTQWSPGNGVLIRRSNPRPESPSPRQISRQRQRPHTHALLRGAAAHFLHSRKIEAGGYLKPYKFYLVDITASESGLQHALAFANTFFLALEAKGHRVQVFGGSMNGLRRPSVDPLENSDARTRPNSNTGLWSPGRLTVAHVNGQLIGLSIVEVATATLMRYLGDGTYVRETNYVAPRGRSGHRHDMTWTTTKELASGRLRLVAYTPHQRVDLLNQWQETDRSSLAKRVPEIVAGIESMAAELPELVAQATRQMEIEWQEREAMWKRHKIRENKRRINESREESRKQLDDIIRHWAQARAQTDFLVGLERDISLLAESERLFLQARLAAVRELLGPLDPMHYFRAWQAPDERYMPEHFEGAGEEE